MGNSEHLHNNKVIIFTGNQSMALFKFRLGIMVELKQLGFKVYAIAPPDVYSKKLVEKGIEFIPIPTIPYETNPLKDLFFFFRLYKIYQKIQPGLIFHYTIKPNIYGTLATMCLGLPSFSIVPGRGHAFHKKNWLFYVAKLLYKYSQKHAVGIWFLNEEDRDFFVEQSIVPLSKTMVLPGEGVNTTYYSVKEFRKKKNQETTTFLLLGRLLWEKGVGVFAEAAQLVKEKYPNTKFQLLGFLDKSDHRVVPEKTVSGWIQNSVLDYLGEVQDVRPYLAQSNCFVLPSFYGEGLPRSLMEAASMQIPLITTAHPGCSRAVLNGINGYLCKPKDSLDLAERMIQFIELTNSEKLEMGNTGRSLMQEQFEEKLIVDIYLRKMGEFLSINLTKEMEVQLA